jgi:hypothetical protein
MSGLAGAASPAIALSPSAVQAAVARGAQITTVPSSLSPTLSQVRNDAPQGFACGGSPTACNAGVVSAKRQLVVFGDSHAAMWFGALARGLSSKYHLLLRWKASCPAAQLTVLDTSVVTGSDCNAWRQKALSQTLADHPTAVVVAERTSGVRDSAGEIFTPARWKTGLLATLTAFTNAHIPVIMIGDNPAFSTIPASCVAIHVTSVQSCAIPPAASDQLVNYAGIEQQAAQHVQAKFISTTSLFCTATLCPPIVNGIFVYFDDTHMTQTYSIYLSKVITKLTGL